MVNNYKELPGQYPEDAAKYAKGIERMNDLAETLQSEGELPERFVKAVKSSIAGSSEAVPSRLTPILFKIEIPTVSEEDYIKTREAVEATGAFIVPIRSISMEDLLAEDLNRGQRRLGYVNDSRTMRATVPPEMEVFINPKAVRIEGSNRLSTNEHKKRITEAETKFKEQLPEGVRRFVGLHMVDPSTMSQLEDKYMDANNGALLLPDFFARTDVQTVQGGVALVGRFDPSDQRGIVDWYRDRGYGDVFAVPVGVLPRKLTA